MCSLSVPFLCVSLNSWSLAVSALSKGSKYSISSCPSTSQLAITIGYRRPSSGASTLPSSLPAPWQTSCPSPSETPSPGFLVGFGSASVRPTSA
ncbi:hypothetical protein BSKO_10884 [Bryopsis sp. KO-2023]|nr:hypothetical protein BSKO_10884 [Bryopsis sp. KO-2023]